MNTDIENAVKNLVDTVIDHETKQAIRNVIGYVFEHEAKDFKDYTGINPSDNEAVLTYARSTDTVKHVYGQAALVHVWLTDIAK